MNAPLPAPVSQDLPTIIRPLVKPAELVQAQGETAQLIQQALTEKVDYGLVPGSKNPSLFKAGGERLLVAFGCHPEYEVVEKEVDHDRQSEWRKRKWNDKRRGYYDETIGTSYGLYRYVINCKIVQNQSGRVIGAHIGSCSTMESKYIDRPRDCENTVLKMAQKRAMVGAVLNTFGLSDRFTNDMEDVHDNAEENGEVAQNPGFDANIPAHKAWVDKLLAGLGVTDPVKIAKILAAITGKQSQEATDIIDRMSKTS